MNVISKLDDLSDRYDVILSDVWGVVHNGERAFPAAAAALTRVREAGKRVILITNSPRPRDGVIAQLGALGVPAEAYDAVVTSGDVTRILINEAPRRIFHIGGERDLALYDGTHAELVEEQEAQAIVCTGLFDDEVETPEDYAPLLQRLRSRNLPFICANPDIIVERGDRMIWCAGAIARDYGLLGWTHARRRQAARANLRSGDERGGASSRKACRQKPHRCRRRRSAHRRQGRDQQRL